MGWPEANSTGFPGPRSWESGCGELIQDGPDDGVTLNRLLGADFGRFAWHRSLGMQFWELIQGGLDDRATLNWLHGAESRRFP